MGFPSPAKDYQEDEINLHKHLVKHPLSTYFMRATDDGMIGANIPAGALLVVDRSLKPTNNKIVVCDLNGERKLRRVIKAPKGWVLHADNPNYLPIVLTKDMDFEIFGVVTSVIIETVKHDRLS
jgi:DNA polymerase V